MSKNENLLKTALAFEKARDRWQRARSDDDLNYKALRERLSHFGSQHPTVETQREFCQVSSHDRQIAFEEYIHAIENLRKGV